MNFTMAKGIVEMEIKRMQSKYPLHAGLLGQFNPVESRVRTMAIGFDPSINQICLYIRPNFVEKLVRGGHLMGILHHEMNHVLFEHIYRKRVKDEWAMVIAEEVTCNEYVPEPIPEDSVLLEQYPFLPPYEDTQTRYQRIRDHKEEEQEEEQEGKPVPFFKLMESYAPPPDPHIKPSDLYFESPDSENEEQSIQDNIQGNIDLIRESLKSATVIALSKMSKDEIAKVLKLTELGNFGEIGQVVASRTEWVDGTYKLEADGIASVMPWQNILRNYIGQVTCVRQSFSRPPRRFPEMAGIMPGKSRRSNKPSVFAVLDTSGSMPKAYIERIDRELLRLRREFQMTIVQCNCSIQTISSMLPSMRLHGGGTDFRPPLETSFLKKYKPDVMVFFTDGKGIAPKREPKVPVIWCLLDNGKSPATWGRVIRMPKHKK